ncbi:MAG TPA: GDSL-type esterase/lipase family protein [Chryseosolibacter sp.]
MKKLVITLFANCVFVIGYCQTSVPYENDVKAIKHYDNMYPQPANPILFVGSSSIRLWKDFGRKFARFDAINRGIGGAVISDILYYTEDLIVRYNPRKIVLYVGENDLPSETTTPDSVLNRTIRLHHAIRKKLPQVPIIYIAMKPSPSRDQLQAKAIAGNDLVRKYFSTQANVVFLDVYTAMLKDGKSRPELFLDDRLHMNEQGYAIWEKLLMKHLKSR